MASDAILGTNPCNARSFAPPIPTGTGSTLADIARGGYSFVATVDAWLKIGKSGSGVVAVPGTTQPAATSQNGAVFLPANAIVALDVPDGVQFSVIGVAATGTLNITGPWITP